MLAAAPFAVRSAPGTGAKYELLPDGRGASGLGWGVCANTAVTVHARTAMTRVALATSATRRLSNLAPFTSVSFFLAGLFVARLRQPRARHPRNATTRSLLGERTGLSTSTVAAWPRSPLKKTG